MKKKFEMLCHEIAFLDAQIKFVQKVSDGSIIIFSLSMNELEQLLKEEFSQLAEGAIQNLLATPASAFTVDGLQQLRFKISQLEDQYRHEIGEAAAAALRQVEEDHEILNKQLKVLSGARARTDKCHEKFDDILLAIDKQIDKSLRAVENVFIAKETELVDQVQRIEQTKQNQLVEQAEDLQNLQSTLTLCLSALDETLAHQDPYSFLEAAAIIENEVEEQVLAVLPSSLVQTDLRLVLETSSLLHSIRSLSILPDGKNQSNVDPSSSQGLMLPQPSNMAHEATQLPPLAAPDPASPPESTAHSTAPLQPPAAEAFALTQH